MNRKTIIASLASLAIAATMAAPAAAQNHYRGDGYRTMPANSCSRTEVRLGAQVADLQRRGFSEYRIRRMLNLHPRTSLRGLRNCNAQWNHSQRHDRRNWKHGKAPPRGNAYGHYKNGKKGR